MRWLGMQPPAGTPQQPQPQRSLPCTSQQWGVGAPPHPHPHCAATSTLLPPHSLLHAKRKPCNSLWSPWGRTQHQHHRRVPAQPPLTCAPACRWLHRARGPRRPLTPAGGRRAPPRTTQSRRSGAGQSMSSRSGATRARCSGTGGGGGGRGPGGGGGAQPPRGAREMLGPLRPPRQPLHAGNSQLQLAGRGTGKRAAQPNAQQLPIRLGCVGQRGK